MSFIYSYIYLFVCFAILFGGGGGVVSLYFSFGVGLWFFLRFFLLFFNFLGCSRLEDVNSVQSIFLLCLHLLQLYI